MQVIVNEVGPRDGLQSQDNILSVAERVKLIAALTDAGLTHIEAGSFVSPKAVPQMGGTDQVFAALPAAGSVSYAALVPNMKGYEIATAAGARVVNVVLSVTETMNQKNIRMSLEQTASVCAEIVKRAANDGIQAQAYLAVAFECPFEGRVDPQVVSHYAQQMMDVGAARIILADTIGAANPVSTRALVNAVSSVAPAAKLTCHFHDTRGMALANILAALDLGVAQFDSSIGGLGGCPFSPGASGNVATEDVVLMLTSMGIETGINPLNLVPVVREAESLTGISLGGNSYRWLARQYDALQGGL